MSAICACGAYEVPFNSLLLHTGIIVDWGVPSNVNIITLTPITYNCTIIILFSITCYIYI